MVKSKKYKSLITHEQSQKKHVQQQDKVANHMHKKIVTLFSPH